ncbi:MAG: DUF2284 domain-containing protein [Nitrososphaerota archaeon]
MKTEDVFRELCDLALKSGADRAKIIAANEVVVDERVQLKCRFPPCVNYGRNLMCPPFTPSVKEFREILSKYNWALLVQMDSPLNEFKTKKAEGSRIYDLLEDKETIARINKKILEDWKRFHALVSEIEREAFNKGNYLALGLVAGSCRLCDSCDVNSPCKRPFEARPSMEAMGIDVYKTAKNAGFEFLWNRKCITYNGLILLD